MTENAPPRWLHDMIPLIQIYPQSYVDSDAKRDR